MIPLKLLQECVLLACQVRSFGFSKVLFWLWVELKTHAVSLNKVQNTGLGNQYDLVGRFFMEHPLLISGKLLFSSPAALYTQRNIRVGEVFIGIALGLSKAVQERANSKFQRQATSHSSRLGRSFQPADVQDSKEKRDKRAFSKYYAR